MGGGGALINHVPEVHAEPRSAVVIARRHVVGRPTVTPHSAAQRRLQRSRAVPLQDRGSDEPSSPSARCSGVVLRLRPPPLGLRWASAERALSPRVCGARRAVASPPQCPHASRPLCPRARCTLVHAARTARALDNKEASANSKENPSFFFLKFAMETCR